MKSLWYPGPKVVLCLMADFPTLLYTWNLGIQLFFMPEAWKVYPIRAEPPCIGHYREYSPTSEIFSAIRSKTFGTRCKPAMYITKKKNSNNNSNKTMRLLKRTCSLQCRRFLWACNLLAKAPCWNLKRSLLKLGILSIFCKTFFFCRVDCIWP